MNTLYYGDNLPILRAMPSETVDLVYLDPPFNSSRSYNVLFKDQSNASSDAQITAFEDTWAWGPSAEHALTDIIQANPGVVDDLLDALKKIIGPSPMLAYLVMMAARLVELRRVLKPTGSLYLHCDPTASHYLKIILDTVFGFENFHNEIIWQRTNAHNDAGQFGRIHDVLLFYTRSKNYTWNVITTEYTQKQINRYKKDKNGRLYTGQDLTASRPNSNSGKFNWRGTMPPASRGWGYTLEQLEKWWAEGRILTKQDGTPRMDGLIKYIDEMPGKPLQSIWSDVPRISNTDAERLGYPTQKPLALLERIIQASSNPGDLILDPFCGCGTAIAAAEKLNRRWIGIDITYLAITLIEGRMKKMFPGIQFTVEGKPADHASARDLANRDRYQFQWWALSLVGAKPVGGDDSGKGKKGKDYGIDGIINYIDNAKQELKRVIVQVKSGHVNSATIRDLHGVLQRESAEIGVLITLEPPTKDMISEAASAGYYKSEFWQKSYPSLQILTIEQLLVGASVQMPPETGTFLAAQKVRKETKQTALDL
jgi:site-specific DNA-methyltransferase (adenine-specific)